MHKSRIHTAFPYFLVALALAARLLPGARTVDDAYITYRYARNLLAGDGLVYNPGERVLGTTTPLYAGILAGPGFFMGGTAAPFPEISLILNAAADAVTCCFLLALGRKLGIPLAGASTGLVWAVLPFSVTFAIGGLETSVFVLLLAATVYFYLDRRFAAAALSAALSLLARPDAGLLILPLAIDRIYLAMRNPGRGGVSWKESAAFGLPLLAWLIPATLYYGSPIPHSLSAKAVAYSLPPDAAFTRLLQHYATPFMENLTFGSAGIVAGLVLYPFLALLGARRLIGTTPRIWPFLAFPWLWFAAYAIANPLIFRWYLTPPLPAYIFSILAGLATLRKDLAAAGRTGALPNVMAAVLLAGPVLLVLRGWEIRPNHGPSGPAPEMAYIELELKYIEAAEFLNPILAVADGEPVLAAADIGALGYYTGVPILDTLGLISPEATAYYPTRPEYHANAYAVAPELILDLKPDFIVLLEVYGRLGLFRHPAFNNGYDGLYTVETDIYGSDGMLIFIRR
ncbi:MAG TPA: hypothetical protein VMN57_09115 [Anaerolineales bacterium]|nr:hypothetical protein [Anaerolineales bacterium]